MNKMLLITALLICAQNVDAASQKDRRTLQNEAARVKDELRRKLIQDAIDKLIALGKATPPLAPEFADEDAPSVPSSPVAARRPLMGVDKNTPSRLLLNYDGSPKPAKAISRELKRLSAEELLGTGGLDDLDDNTTFFLDY